MLVLSRKEMESLVVELPNGDTIVLKVLKIRGSKVNLGITAPAHIRVDRSEIWTMRLEQDVQKRVEYWDEKLGREMEAAVEEGNRKLQEAAESCLEEFGL